MLTMRPLPLVSTGLIVLLLCACGATPTATPLPPTATPVPPTSIPVPPTSTPMPPTATSTSSAKAIPYVAGAEWPKMVSVGPYQLYTHCYGTGDPVVVVEPGLGNITTAWSSVTRLVREKTTICVYNRANLGESGKTSGPRSSGEIIEDLHNLVASLEITKPFILVGHSMGGFQGILYTARWPSDIAALILVEPSHPGQWTLQAQYVPTPSANELSALTSLRKQFSAPPEVVQPEGWDFARSAAEVSAVKTLGSVPLTVIAGGVKGQARDLGGLYTTTPPDWILAFAEGRVAMQKDFLKLSTNSVFLVSEASGHMVNYDDAPLIADTIIKYVELLRKK